MRVDVLKRKELRSVAIRLMATERTMDAGMKRGAEQSRDQWMEEMQRD